MFLDSLIRTFDIITDYKHTCLVGTFKIIWFAPKPQHPQWCAYERNPWERQRFQHLLV